MTQSDHDMRPGLAELIAAVERSRADLLTTVASLTDGQGAFKPNDAWSVAEIVEHLYFAELTGVSKVWEATDAVRAGHGWTQDVPHRGKPIEQIVDETWREKEVAPPVATPRVGGPLGFWAVALRSLQPVLRDLAQHLSGLSLDEVVAPHVLSGPLDARQRFEFLRFHLDRHHAQIRRTMGHPAFPTERS